MNPSEDGKTHINIYSKGVTELGVFLSNFTRAPLVVRNHGRFLSVEGLWYYLSTTHPQRESLRGLFGFKAKEFGKKCKHTHPHFEDDFKNIICEAIVNKLEGNPKMLMAFKDSTLPFAHYYVFSQKVIDVADRHAWLIEFFETFRKELKAQTSQ